MARPKVFLSSTYYDLKYIRSSLENFIDSLSFESILSEKGHIAYSPEIPLDESCYREVGNADIFIIIIGGRYGSEKNVGKEKKDTKFFDRYESITKHEYKSAVNRDVPTYILIEKSVYSEYEIFLKNKNNESINYVHVDSINIFYFIEDILSQTRKNPVHQFDKYSDIEAWLKEQWAGLFRELLNQRSKQTQITSLASQVHQLEEINKTLKRYLEEVISKVLPDVSKELIENESTRLEIANQISILEKYEDIINFSDFWNISMTDVREAIISCKSIEDFFDKIQSIINQKDFRSFYRSENVSEHFSDPFNDIRKKFGLQPFEVKDGKIEYYLESKRDH